ncbi:MAG: sigma-70 family RNA polymerase sigma factor [Candidatus Omnitrophica bacterium]|nr:sigma-70 family RNA polymerase sigma factor [Candidatus Omnitrophota bacterium]
MMSFSPAASLKNPFETIIKEYQNKIYRLALSISRNEKDAEDILQNTLIKIVRKLPTFEHRSSISTWIYRITYNESLMYLRKKRRLLHSSNALRQYNSRLFSGFTINWPKLPDQALIDEESKARLDEALQHLAIQYRMPLLLHRIENLSISVCSQILGIKVATVKTRLHRAYGMLKDLLQHSQGKGVPLSAQKRAQCSTWTSFIFDYAQDRLGSRKKILFRRHIKDCPGCSSFLASYQQAIRITKALDCRDIPPDLKEKVQTFLVGHRKKH